MHQISIVDHIGSNETYRDKLITLLTRDLDFHGQDSKYASHNFHSFPSKFPPQLPHKFIVELTNPGDTVLDPMMGSGTTILEAFLSGRYGIGFDIDPLALMISKLKVTPLDVKQIDKIGNTILEKVSSTLKEKRTELEETLKKRCDSKTQQFIEYWFAPETQIELLALITEIETVPDREIRYFFELAFSAMIITKTGGVSLAFDLAHTRPHKAKVVIDKTGKIILGNDPVNNSSRRIKLLTKTLRSPLEEFDKKFRQNLKGVPKPGVNKIQPYIKFANAQSLPLDDGSIDLIVTSPPYASNAIDYMRAHKFSLVWMRYSVDDLSQKRKEYIGGELVAGMNFERLPDNTAKLVEEFTRQDKKKGQVLHRYYSEMTQTLREMFRVLKPGRAAIVVVGNSVMRGRDTQISTCLADIGRAIGFEIPKIGIRLLDRNRRMLPAGVKIDLDSQIQQRMHEEHVIGFYKPNF